MQTTYEFDVFISHASEDKPYINSLVLGLTVAGLRVWFDSKELSWGDDLRPSIDRGLLNCRYGIVVFSPSFLRKKKWTEYELNALFSRERFGENIILPVWHEISREDLQQYSPAFADRIALQSSHDTPPDIAWKLLALLDRLAQTGNDSAALQSTSPRQSAEVDRQAEENNALGDYYRNAKENYSEALRYYHIAADKGSPVAECNIGYMYAGGLGVQKNWSHAFEWTQKSANRGFPPALCNLGRCYDDGIGVTIDHNKAIEYYRQSADGGYPEAQRNLAAEYVVGKLVQKDYEIAMGWLHRAWEKDEDAFNDILSLRKRIADEASYRGPDDGAMSPGAMRLLGIRYQEAIRSFCIGDWGHIDLSRELANMRALKSGGELVAEYRFGAGPENTVVFHMGADRQSYGVRLKSEVP